MDIRWCDGRLHKVKESKLFFMPNIVAIAAGVVD